MTEIRAAGGVVRRRRADGGDEVVLVHRPAYDDWSLPKGKLEDGEREEDAALREVEEETGLQCRLERELATTRYRDARGRRKIVRYWRMRAGEGAAGSSVGSFRQSRRSRHQHPVPDWPTRRARGRRGPGS